MNSEQNIFDRLVAVSDRHVFDDAPDPRAAFLAQIRRIGSWSPKMLVLREKDLTPETYRELLLQVLDLFDENDPFRQRIVPHLFYETALELEIPRIHLPLGLLKELHEKKPEILTSFRLIGTSVHSPADAREAEESGAHYCFAGNVWETGCKPGLEGRGLQYLKETAAAVSIPVYGIGGVSLERMPEVLAAGAAGGCMMSGFMKM